MIHMNTEADLEEGLIVLPVERHDPTSRVLSTCACFGLVLIIGGILFIRYLFDKKIWI
jgi:hypothetical protein